MNSFVWAMANPPVSQGDTREKQAVSCLEATTCGFEIQHREAAIAPSCPGAWRLGAPPPRPVDFFPARVLNGLLSAILSPAYGEGASARSGDSPATDPPSEVKPVVSIVSPSDGSFISGNLLSVTVAFSAKLEKGKFAGNVQTVILNMTPSVKRFEVTTISGMRVAPASQPASQPVLS
ncbi:MAG: hypothetical protein HYU36_19785 [Planctomycetes bacterium]|nr:hypothetical protein [Planctomycetota bacterium]